MNERRPYERKFSPTCSRWYVLWDGKQQWLGNTKAEADTNLERLRNGHAVVRAEKRRARWSVADYVDLYLDWVQAQKPDRYDARRNALRAFHQRFAEVPVKKLTRRQVQLWLAKQPDPVRARKAVVNCFTRLVKLGHLESTPITAIEVTVREIVERFLAHAEKHYVKRGQQTSEVAAVRAATAPLLDLYGSLPARHFGPTKLKVVREAMIRKGWCRTAINHQCSRIRRVFRYAVELELIPAETLNRLKALSPLLHGRTEAVEAEPVEPVSAETVDATLPHLRPQVADMVRVEKLAGMRPGELCSMQWNEIDMSGPVWLYSPTSHKVEHHGLKRVIAIGPQAQAILMKYRGFGPVWPGKGKPMGAASYRRAITRGCERAFNMPKELLPTAKQLRELTPEEREDVKTRAEAWRAENCWHPNQLRHSFATELRQSGASLDDIAATLGHTRITTTQVYAQNGIAKATAVAAKVG